MFHNFRKDLVQKQRKLYNAVVQSTDRDNMMLKSEETQEFIECSGGDEYFVGDFQIKTEASDNLGLCVENYMDQEEKL